MKDTRFLCPKCGYAQRPGRQECQACGVIFAKYDQSLEPQKDKTKEKDQPAPIIVQQEAPSSGRFLQLMIAVLLTAGVTYYFTRGGPAGGEKPAESRNTAAKLLQNESEESSLLPAIATPSPARSSVTTTDSSTTTVVRDSPIENARKATVTLQTPWGVGSGFFVNDNTIITNKHVVEVNKEKLEEGRKKIAENRRLLDLEQKKIEEMRQKMRELPRGATRDQLGILIEQQEQKLAKALPQQTEAEQWLAVMNKSISPEDIKIILADGAELAARYLAVSKKYDLALLSLVFSGGNYLPRPSGGIPIQQGDKVFTIGSPVGLRNTLTAGVFSGYRQRKEDGHKLLQTDAPINPGNSGGPLINEKGQVLGVNTMILQNTEGIGFAIPIEVVYEEFGLALF